VQAAKQQLGLTTLKDTEAQAAKLRQAFETLKTSGTLSASEITIAQQRLQASLKELQGTVTTTGKSFSLIGEAKTQLLGLVQPVFRSTPWWSAW
jgi:hypothetical protein